MAKEQKARPINAREDTFCRRWLLLQNATQAAIDAGYSQKTAASQGHQLLQKPKIKTHIAQLQKDVADLVGITPAMLAAELKRMALADIGDFVTFGPNGVSIKDSASVDTKCVLEVSENRGAEGGVSRKIKLYDKKGAIDSLNKMMGWNAAEKQELSGPRGGPIPVEGRVVIVELPSNGRDKDRSPAGTAD